MNSRNFNTFWHAYGYSGLKSTDAIFECWKRHPEFPMLTLVGWEKKFGKWIADENISNIQYLSMITTEKLRELQNSNSIHLCPSVREGYGHYINEARANGALVVTSNYAPMNELVQNDVSGILVDYKNYIKPSHQYLRHVKALEVSIDWEDICFAVEKVLLMPVKDRKAMGDEARKRFESESDFSRKAWMEMGRRI